DRRSRVAQQLRDQLKGHFQPLAQRFATSALEMKPIAKLVMVLPSFRREQRLADGEIARGELVGARRLGFAPSAQVELRNAQSFGLIGDERQPEIELSHDLE